MLPIAAITVEIEKKNARKHHSGLEGYYTKSAKLVSQHQCVHGKLVLEESYRLHRAPSPAKPSPDKKLYPGPKRQIQESFQPKKVKTNTKRRKAKLGKR